MVHVMHVIDVPFIKSLKRTVNVEKCLWYKSNKTLWDFFVTGKHSRLKVIPLNAEHHHIIFQEKHAFTLYIIQVLYNFCCLQ